MKRDRLLRWICLALSVLVGCAGADPDLAPDEDEAVAAAVTALLPTEGLAYLAERALAERPELRHVRVVLERAAMQSEAGGTIIHGPSEGLIPVESVRLAPDAEGTAVMATVRLGPAEIMVPVLHRPRLGAPERCHLRMSTQGGLGSVDLLPAVGVGREIQAVGAAVLELDDAETVLDADCPGPVPDHAQELAEVLDKAVSAAVAAHLERVAQAAVSAAGPGQPWIGGARRGASVLRASLSPSRSGSAVRVRRQGLARVYDVAVDAAASGLDDPQRVACAPAPADEIPPSAPSPSPPALGPDGAAYRLALAIDGAFLDRAIAWAAASGKACEDDGPDAGMEVSDASELQGVATLVTGGRPLRTRLRPGGGVRTSLQPTSRAPLRLTLPRLGLAVYGDVDGAPLALARLVADVIVDADVTFGDDSALRLKPVSIEVTGAQAAPTVLPGGAAGVVAAAPSLFARALERLLEGLPVPLDSWTDRPAEFVGAEATESHLMVYLDLR